MKSIILLLILLMHGISEGFTLTGSGAQTTILVNRYASLNAAIHDIGTTSTDLYINVTTTLTGNLTIPSNIKLIFSRGGSINQGTFTLTINGPVQAEAFKIFAGMGSVTIGQMTDHIYPEWFGAVDSGSESDSANNTAAIQKAIDSTQHYSGANSTPIIFLGRGYYIIGSKITIKSASVIRGLSPYAHIKTSSTYSDTTMFYLNDVSLMNVYIEKLHFISTLGNGVSAITANPGLTVNGATFRNLVFSTDYGMNLGAYSQSCLFDSLTLGTGNQLINNWGNINVYLNLQVIGIGSDNGFTDAPIYIHDSNGGYADHIHVEFNNPIPRTSYIHLLNVDDFKINNGFWIEDPPNTAGINILLENCQSIEFGGTNEGIAPNKVLKLVNSLATINIITRNTKYAHALGLNQYFSVDNRSFLTINTLVDCTASDLDLTTSPYIRVLNRIKYNNQTGSCQTVPSLITSQMSYQGLSLGNLLPNANFNMGTYGWTLQSVDSAEVIASSLDNGKMLHLVTTTQANAYVQRAVSLIAGVPVTFSGFVKVVDAANSGSINVMFTGGGKWGETEITPAGLGWQHFTFTGIPPSDGSYDVGFDLVSASGNSTKDFYIARLQLVYGLEGAPDSGKIQELYLAGKNITYGTAAPTTGTWNQGDRVFNSTPSVGGVDYWVCTVGGTPGTWVAKNL